jgi:hypothetical protein
MDMATVQDLRCTNMKELSAHHNKPVVVVRRAVKAMVFWFFVPNSVCENTAGKN